MPSPGDTISHYRLISAIGKGGMGEVYLAEDSRLDRRVAIKILLDEVADDPDRLRRFIQEAKAASALNHPNILTVYEIGEYEHSRYIAAEMIEGDTLRERMKRGGIGLKEAIGISLQTAAALAAAHESGILHRDIKPENIMVRADGLVKVLDFGLAKLTEQPPQPSNPEDPTIAHMDTQPGLIIGTVAYMSPEQVRAQKLDARSDIFSLGTVMYELFAGQFPFKGDSHVDLASSILKDDPEPLSRRSPDLPGQLERIVEKTLRKDRDTRYQHVKDLKIDLEDLLDELKFEAKRSDVHKLPAATTQPLSLSESISTTRRFTLLHALLFCAAAVLLLGGMWYLRPAGGSPAQPNYKLTEVASWNNAPGEVFSTAKFSPDAKMIAFVSTRSGTKNIWVAQAGSTDAIPITNDAFANTDPIWSPKGDEVAFFSLRDSGRLGIWRASKLGINSGTPRFIAPLAETGSLLGSHLRRWTTSGKIYYQLKDALYSVDVANGASQKVRSLDDDHVIWLSIAEDEKNMLFATQNNDDWRIAATSAAGGDVTEVVHGSGRLDDGVTWLPDKKRVFYSSTVDGVLQVFTAGTGSGKSVKLTASEGDLSITDASSDARSIVVASSKEESNLWRATVADGRETPLSRDINTKIWPAVAPDNERIAFQSLKNLNQGDKLFDTAVVTKNMRSTSDADRPFQLAERGLLPVWSPDGATVAFLKQSAGKNALYSVSANGGGEHLIANDVTTAGYSVSPYNYAQAAAFAWSPDGSRIAYVSMKSGTSNMWITRLADGQDTMLTDNKDLSRTLVCPLWSSDSRRIAYSSETLPRDRGVPQTYGLAIMSVDAHQVTGVYEEPKELRLVGWSADETALIFAERSSTRSLLPEMPLMRVSASGGSPTAIANLKNVYFYNIVLSDDRKTIAYAARSNEKDDLWTIASSGGTARKLTANNDTGLYYSRLAWLHDGSAIVFGKQTRFSLLSMITDIDL